jgi:hypothetical protein
MVSLLQMKANSLSVIFALLPAALIVDAVDEKPAPDWGRCARQYGTMQINRRVGMSKSHWPSSVLLVLGIVDLLRGVLHTFFIDWAVRTFARLDLSAARHDQLTLLGAFGISNLLTGLIYILISRKAKELSNYVLLMIPCAYAIGYIGLKISGVKAHAAFYGKYFMLGYLGVCIATVALSRFRRETCNQGA